MALDEDVTRLARGANLATVVTLMPNGQPQWSDNGLSYSNLTSAGYDNYRG